MFSDTIEYEDFDGNKRKETLYFNISSAELIELEALYPGGYLNKLQRDIDRADNKAIMMDFKDFIKLAYGKKSEDGRKFTKSSEIYEDFVSTSAYDEFFVKLLSDPDYALKFVVASFPNNTGMSQEELMSKAKQEVAQKTREENYVKATTMVEEVVAAD